MKKSWPEMDAAECQLVDLLVYPESLGLAVSLVILEVDLTNIMDYSLS